jgi:uncharacterized protein (DUF1778 family)
VGRLPSTKVIPVASQTAKPERVNFRLSTESLNTIKKAAAAQGQDVTSFMTGAALDQIGRAHV